MAVLIDPTIARLVARRVAGDSSLSNSYLMDRLRRDLAFAVPYSEQLVAEASGIPAPPPVRWDVIDRAAWTEANISSMSVLLRPLADKVAPRVDSMPLAARIAQRAAVSIEVGVLLGYVSRRVLGQFDLLVPDAARELPSGSRRSGRRRVSGGAQEGAALYFVGPNIVELERRYAFVPRDFALWVALHEVTHRFQFDGVPWLRPRFLDLLASYLESLQIDGRALAGRLASGLVRMFSKDTPPEERNPIYLLASNEQRRMLDQIQALMAVVEGHGNYVMDSVGARVIPSMKRMRSVFERRRQQLTAVQRAFHYAIGLEMKMRQYELGQHFCETVVAREGPQALHRLWANPETFPTLVELRDPERWLTRVA